MTTPDPSTAPTTATTPTDPAPAVDPKPVKEPAKPPAAKKAPAKAAAAKKAPAKKAPAKKVPAAKKAPAKKATTAKKAPAKAAASKAPAKKTPAKKAPAKKAPAKKAAAKKATSDHSTTKTSLAGKAYGGTVQTSNGPVRVWGEPPTAEAAAKQVGAIIDLASKRLGSLGVGVTVTPVEAIATAEGIVAGKLAPTKALLDLAFAGAQPTVEFWSTPVGIHAAATLGKAGTGFASGSVTRPVAASILGVAEGTVAQLKDRGFIASDEAGKCVLASVLVRVAAQTGLVR